jgi:predicted nucleotidyltransferase
MSTDYHGIVPPDAIRRLRAEVPDLAARHGVRNVRVFGSVARGDDRADSDVDFLVDVEPGRTLLDVRRPAPAGALGPESATVFERNSTC